MTTKTTPDVESPAYRAMQPAWSRSRLVRGGTDAFRANAAELLPRYPAEPMLDWQRRVERTFVTSFLDQAIQMAIGLATRHDPELGKDVPEVIRQDWEDLDGEGNHGAVVTSMAMDAALADGHHVLLTEFPPADPDLSEAEEQARGLRPYVVRVGIDQILSWRTAIVGSRRQITQVVIRECEQQEDGPFSTKTVTRYRVYRHPVNSLVVSWEVWEESLVAGATVVTMTADGVLAGPTRIPIAVIYGGKQTGVLTSKPALDDLAQANIRWAQVESDRTETLHKAGIILLEIVGELQNDGETGKPPAELVLRQGGAVMLKAGGSIEFKEANGNAMPQQLEELARIEKRMAAMALSIMKNDPAGPETATESRQRAAKEESILQRLVRSTRDALEQTLIFMAEYRNARRRTIEVGNLAVTLRKDFAEIVSPEVIRLASDLEERRQLTMDRLLRLVQRSGMLGDDFDPEAEVQALAEQAADAMPRDLTALADDELEAEFTALEAQRAERVARRAA